MTHGLGSSSSGRLRRSVATLAGLLAGGVLITGCDFDVYALPLPGGTDVGSDPITVTVEFRDVLDLVPKSAVKVNDVNVGQVKAVSLDGYTAKVVLLLRRDTELPDDTLAEIRQTSLLGEKFVSLSAPDGGGQGELSSGDTIALERSGRNPEIEEVLGALSLILNGGGVAQAQTITQEINKALGGRESAARSALDQVDTFTATLDSNKADIVNAIEALNRLSLAATEQQDDIDAALDELPSALTSIDGQRQDLVRMLAALDQLGNVGVRVIQASKEATVDSIQQLQPVLTQLAASGDDLVNSFNVFLTYPFVDEVVGRDPQVARNLHVGDYTNLSATLELDLTQGLPPPPGLPTAQCTPLAQIPDLGPLPPLEELCEGAVNTLNQCLASPTLRECANLPQFVIDQVCAAIAIPGLCPGAGNQSPGIPLPTSALPTIPLPTIVVPSISLPQLPLPTGGGAGGGLGGVLGPLGRAGTAPWRGAASAGPTMGQLQEAYDPSLVNLLVPMLVTGASGAGGAR